MSASLATLRRRVELKRELEKRKSDRNTVVGIVCPEKGLIKAITNEKSEWVETQEDIDVYLPLKLEKVLKSNKRFIVVIGGRGSAKSVGVADICVIDTKDNQTKTYFLREYQSSIKNSVHSLIEEEISRFKFKDFNVLNQSIEYKDKPAFEFTGLSRNVDSVKSAHGFKRYVVEEAQFISEKSLTTLTPTARNKPKNGLPSKFIDDDIIEQMGQEIEKKSAQVVFIANPGSSEDPFSKRFINPYKEVIDRDGFYEDDLHLIVKMNYQDNPWFDDSGLEDERQWDIEHRSDAFNDHQWGGEFNDSVEDALILGEWFEACIDAHIKLGFSPQGAKIASHDPSDTGFDTKGHAFRYGSVFLDVTEKLDGDVNEGGHWSVGRAIQQGADYYTWDCDGMGVGLNEQINKDFAGKHTIKVMFKGSESPDSPEAAYNSPVDSSTIDQKKIKDVFKNKKNQYYWELRDRIYRTYRAVMFPDERYQDPATLISFSSDIKLLSKLKSQICRLPVKPNGNGYLQLYPKPEMKTKFQIVSPNLVDPVMMSMRYMPQTQTKVVRPRPIKPMGLR